MASPLPAPSASLQPGHSVSICGGYASPSSRIDRDVLGGIGRESDRDSVTRIVPTKLGHLICQHDPRRLTPLNIAQDANGNLLTLLGFIRWTGPGTREDGLLRLVARHGVDVLETHEGQFVAIFVEGESGTIHIVNDRFSSRPFYLLSVNGTTFYASNLAFLFDLARIRPTPDCLGWLQILRFGHTLGQRTNCTGARRLRPASHVVIDSRSVTERCYWTLEHNPDPELHPDLFADQVFHALEASAQWRARRSPRSIIALSGGLDSRLVAACTPKDGGARAMTFVNSVESPGTPEVLAAAEVAKRLGLPHEIRPVEPGSYSKTADLVVRLTDGLVPMHHPSKTMQFINRLDGGYRYLLGGGPGDSLAGAFVPGEEHLDPDRTEELLKAYCARRTGGREYLSTIVSDALLDEFYPRLAESMQDSVAELRGPTAAHRITAWAMTVRQPAFTFTTPFHNHAVFEEATPHLGYAYTDLMLRLPATWLLWRNFYAYMIYRVLPELRDVIYANTGRPLSGRLETFGPRAAKGIGPKERLKAIVRTVPFYRQVRRLLARSAPPVALSFDYSVMRADSTLVNSTEEMLDLPGVAALVDRERCRRFIQAFRAGHIQGSSTDDASLFGTLATLCLRVKQLHG